MGSKRGTPIHASGVAKKATASKGETFSIPAALKGQAKATGAKYDPAQQLWCSDDPVTAALLRGIKKEAQSSQAAQAPPSSSSARKNWKPSAGSRSSQPVAGLSTPTKAAARPQPSNPDKAANASTPAHATPQSFSPATPSPAKRGKRYFNVPFLEKDDAKDLGAKWDATAKAWYAPTAAVADAMSARWLERTETCDGAGQGRVYFSVPFEEKDAAKELGARWDSNKKLWYAADVNTASALRSRWGAVDTRPLQLEASGEDRTFGGNTLYVDLLPHSAHGKTLRNILSEGDFSRLKSSVLQRAAYKCECCRAPASIVHPRYKYSWASMTQTVVRLLAMCHECKSATHMGLQHINNNHRAALSHLARVRGWSMEAAAAHEGQAWELWQQRDGESWAMDTSLLQRAGLQPHVSEEADDYDDPFVHAGGSVFAAMLGR